MKKVILAGLAATALYGGSATAADLARRVPVYAPPPPLVAYFTWTGCYVGGNVGGIWAKNDWNDTIVGDFGTNTASGALGGLQAGCNYQVGGWVFGIQGDYDWTNAKNDSVNLFFPTLTDHSQLKSLASVTGRVGYAWDRFLGYVKGGGAWETSDASLLLVGGSSLATASVTQSGWTIGIGGEYAFLNWLTGFIEYDYYGFSNNNSSALVCTPAVCPPVGFANVGLKTNVNVLKVGLNFKFGG